MAKSKPQGASGAVSFGSTIQWNIIPFPNQKDERERLIAELFIKAFEGWVAMESEPSLAPFGKLEQNPENDLDFTLQTAAGERRMELAEFAPLAAHGPTFESAPKELSPNEKARLAAELIRMKSQHQGGAGRILVLYVTEQGFWIDPITVETLRRDLAGDPPKFDRVYYVSPHDLESASVTEVHPGKPHHFFGDESDEGLAGIAARAILPHPTTMDVRVTFKGEINGWYGGRRVRLAFSMNLPGRLEVQR